MHYYSTQLANDILTVNAEVFIAYHCGNVQNTVTEVTLDVIKLLHMWITHRNIIWITYL